MVRTGARPTTTTTTHLLGGVTQGDSDSSQVARGSSRPRTASSLSSVDQTAHFLLAAPNPGRPWPKQGRAGGRKCPLATATHHPRAASETASMHENGSPAPRSPGKNASDLEANDLHRSTRDAAALASGALSPVLETQVKGSCSQAEGRCGNDRLDQGDGERKPALGC